ncbi:MAG: hypothetical protein AVDCRST_MAG93-2771, partial [uncultured Chloroflexia bacterium]
AEVDASDCYRHRTTGSRAGRSSSGRKGARSGTPPEGHSNL